MARPLHPLPASVPAKPGTRLPLAVKLESRDGSLIEGLITNGFVDVERGKTKVALRPGLDVAYAAGGTGQGVFTDGTELFVVTSATITYKPNKLTFTVQPSDVGVGASITPAVKVAIQNAAGSTLTYATNTVTIAIQNNPEGATLSGTLSVAAVAGVATFSDLSLDKAGDDYTLVATIPGLSKVSSAFDVANAFTLVAVEFDGIDFGYFRGPAVGSLTPDSINGVNVDKLYVTVLDPPQAGVDGLRLDMVEAVASDFITSLTVNGSTYNTASADVFSGSGWAWYASTTPSPYSTAGTYAGSYVV